MVGEDEKDRFSGSITNRRAYLRSVSWSDRSPSNPNPRQQSNSKTRACLPPLLPLSISKRNVEEWPRAGSDDLGVWPQPTTPGTRRGHSSEHSDTERVFEFKKDKLAFFEKECSRISDHIYLGSDAIAKNRGILRLNKITHVLNCVGFVCPEYFKGDLVYKTLWLQDSPSEDITSILYDVFDYFEDVREQGGRVFVHCFQGISRSTSLVIAYLMWREGQSFEEAFQYVKAARGVTNPNMGFACQLLQCQKRVHAVPASPNSVLRMYRMAPHSPYDPLHLVPKMLNHPGIQGLDSRGAFIVHIPSAIYVWIGRKCDKDMSNTAGVAASQVIRYERAQGQILIIDEGEEPIGFWDALAMGESVDEVPVNKDDRSTLANRVGERKVDVYDLDFEIFHKALSGGDVLLLPVSRTGSETYFPARQSGWGDIRPKLAEGTTKELATSSKLNFNTTQPDHATDMSIEVSKDEERRVSPCSSPGSFCCSPNGSPYIKGDASYGTINSLPLSSPSCSPDSFFDLMGNSPKPNSKSPSLSPSNSDYSSSFAFSPSSSNWSDTSYVSSQQPSPAENSCVYKENIPSLADPFSSNNNASRVPTICLPCRVISPSIAERRGSNPPPRMLLNSVEKPPQVPRKMVKSWSFSLPDLDDEIMLEAEYKQFNRCSNEEERTPQGNKFFSLPSNDNTEFIANSSPILYHWPTMNKVGMHCLGLLDAKSVYLMYVAVGKMVANNHNTLYIWLGHDSLDEQLRSDAVITADSPGSNVARWEKNGRDFLNRLGLPMDATVQVIRQGDEPEQFISLFV